MTSGYVIQEQHGQEVQETKTNGIGRHPTLGKHSLNDDDKIESEEYANKYLVTSNPFTLFPFEKS